MKPIFITAIRGPSGTVGLESWTPKCPRSEIGAAFAEQLKGLWGNAAGVSRGYPAGGMDEMTG